jgi:pimeloyl-ACP methyl ester carboxylesterase
MPGYGFSGKPTTTGWGPARIASAWVALMKRLGYTKFVAAGGDWGGVITDLMGAQAPPELIGIHTNFPGIFPPEIDKALRIGGSLPSNLSAEEKAACDPSRHIQTCRLRSLVGFDSAGCDRIGRFSSGPSSLHD